MSKNQPKKKPFFLFFELLVRKFWDLIKLNLLFLIPAALAVVMILFLSSVTGLIPVVIIPLVLVSPFVAGLTFVTRNYAREEHAFILSDFLRAVKNNWLAFLINGMVCYVVYLIISFSINFYAVQLKTNSMLYIPMFVCFIISLFFIFSQYYVPVLIITFDLKLNQIYKNSFIFALVGLWRNLLLTVILFVIIFGVYIMTQLMLLTFLIASVIIVFLLFSFCMFLINFTVYPLINKTMIEPYAKKEEDTDDKIFTENDIK
ncbi:MAG TPA: DUF624 domain-containing protein [Ruminiclostridium sp.]|nr:DUF624 domain-containing protein [Ruminiclostridium sp.]